MEILQLRYFCDAAEGQNFSQTAKKFGVPVSNISQTIKRLERELDVELFSHMSNKISLNEQGKLFYGSAKSALTALEEGKRMLADCKDKIAGEIKLLVLANRRLVTKAIENFKRKYPEVAFVIKHNNSGDEDFDLIICDEYFPDTSYDTSPLITEDILLATQRGSALSEKEQISIRDLKDERFITMPHGSSMYDITNRLCEGFVPNIAIQSDDPYYIRKYVAMGLGVAFFPSISWHGQFSDNVAFKSIGEIKRTTVIAQKRGKYLSKQTALFTDMLKNVADETKSL